MANVRYLAVGEESEYGTPVAYTDYVDILEESIKVSEKKKALETIRMQSTLKHLQLQQIVSGSIKMITRPDEIDMFLKWFFGAVTTTDDGNASPVAYKHEFKSTTDTVMPFTCGIGAEVFERKITSAIIDELTIDAPARDIVCMELGILGSKEEKATIGTPTGWSTLDPFEYHEATHTLGGTDKTNQVMDLSVALRRNLLTDDAIPQGSRYMARAVPTKFQCSGKVSMYLADDDQYDALLAGTEFALQAKYIGGTTGSVETGFENYLLQIDLPKCVYVDATPNISDREALFYDGSFEAHYDETSEYMALITVINTESTVP